MRRGVLQICRFTFVGNDEKKPLDVVPKIRSLRVYGMLNENHRRYALVGQPYTIPYYLVNDNIINIIIDYYSHKVIELNPIDWENTLTGTVYIFAYGELPSSFVDVTFSDYYKHRYFGCTCNKEK